MSIGQIVGVGKNVIPMHYLECNGSAVSRTTYADLFTAIGTTYGVGDGSTTFNLPDFDGLISIGVGPGAGLTSRSLADTGGARTHTLTIPELPSHAHSYLYGNTANSPNLSGTGGRRNVTSVSMSNAGSGNSHNNMQPYVVMKHIIKT